MPKMTNADFKMVMDALAKAKSNMLRDARLAGVANSKLSGSGCLNDAQQKSLDRLMSGIRSEVAEALGMPNQTTRILS